MSISSSPTPPSRALIDDERRFKSITLPRSRRRLQYKVIRKLGEGSHSTVWLAHDLNNSRYVALKILVSEILESTTELRILRHIIEFAPEEGSRYITRLLDEFEHRGPNGLYKCLVLEPMGPSINTMVEELPQFNPRKRGMKIRYLLQMAKSILKQSLQALAFLHENGIAYGDFQPGNILFALNDIDSTPEELASARGRCASPADLSPGTEAGR
ncbi:unnamed protein product [Penicillium viridicatum]